MSKLLEETFQRHLTFLRKRLNEVSNQDVSGIQSFIDNNQFLKGKTVSPNDLVESRKYILYVTDDSLSHIKERHSDESKPGSTFDSSVDLKSVLQKVLNMPPSEDANGRVKWLGVNSGGVIGKFGVMKATPEEVASMQDYQMPDGRKEMVKITNGERTPTNQVSVITSELGKLSDGRLALSLITMFPGGTKTSTGDEIPMDRGQFASKGFYFVVKGGGGGGGNKGALQEFKKISQNQKLKGWLSKILSSTEEAQHIIDVFERDPYDLRDTLSYYKYEDDNVEDVYELEDDYIQNNIINVLKKWLEVNSDYKEKRTSAGGDLDKLDYTDEHPGADSYGFLNSLDI
jgi:hypothetical protein